MIDDFTPMMTVERVRDVQAHFITLGGGDDYRSTLREANELMVVLRAGASASSAAF